ncbi:hypothetical protein K439DRAFT_1616330 [Ramaria rubella]|nr:hypothetical protein K439DRAFT_1616330 [Ramaria rubella]
MDEKKALVASQMPPRVPAPSHRHAAPSGPWPWQDLDDNIPESKPSSESIHTTISEGHNKYHWVDYPECLFPNWKADQVERSKMKIITAGSERSVIYHVDVADDGHFSDQGQRPVQGEKEFEDVMRETSPRERVRVRTFFVENLSLPVMQMLGTKYIVEPFFWTSSVNWIPARYQENAIPNQSDHITITLKFPRAARLDNTYPLTPSMSHIAIDQVIDTQRPLPLRSSDDLNRMRDHVLILDLLALHMVRQPENSTIISYHPTSEWKTTSAANLHSRVYLAGQSIYWQNIFKKSNDPTFVLLATLWYALYAWDEAFETLWEHICQLELNVISTNDMHFTQELHKIRAHLLHYASLLEDFNQSVHFVLDTPNPAMDHPKYEAERKSSRALLEKECKNLLTQIDRLKMSREMWDKRLKNVMHLVFSSVNIEDSKHMQRLTEAAVRDSAAMKQISYLTMVFLPASFAAGIFGMNIKEINPGTLGSLAHYFETALPLTIVTIWVIVAYQGKWHEGEGDMSIWMRLMWPIMYVRRLLDGRQEGGGSDTSTVV